MLKQIIKILLTGLILLSVGWLYAGEREDKSLIKAAEAGDVAQVKELLEKGADVNAKSNYGFTALIYAALNGHKEVSDLLLSKVAKTNITSEKEAKLNNQIIAYLEAINNTNFAYMNNTLAAAIAYSFMADFPLKRYITKYLRLIQFSGTTFSDLSFLYNQRLNIFDDKNSNITIKNIVINNNVLSPHNGRDLIYGLVMPSKDISLSSSNKAVHNLYNICIAGDFENSKTIPYRYQTLLLINGICFVVSIDNRTNDIYVPNLDRSCNLYAVTKAAILTRFNQYSRINARTATKQALPDYAYQISDNGHNSFTLPSNTMSGSIYTEAVLNSPVSNNVTIISVEPSITEIDTYRVILSNGITFLVKASRDSQNHSIISISRSSHRNYFQNSDKAIPDPMPLSIIADQSKPIIADLAINRSIAEQLISIMDNNPLPFNASPTPVKHGCAWSISNSVIYTDQYHYNYFICYNILIDNSCIIPINIFLNSSPIFMTSTEMLYVIKRYNNLHKKYDINQEISDAIISSVSNELLNNLLNAVYTNNSSLVDDANNPYLDYEPQEDSSDYDKFLGDDQSQYNNE